MPGSMAVWNGPADYRGKVRDPSKTYVVLWVRHPVVIQLQIELTQGQFFSHSGIKPQPPRYPPKGRAAFVD